MHKKLASDLTSLAHAILQMKNKEDVFELKQKAYEVYEKLSVLVYIEEYINNTPNPSKTKQELLSGVLLAEQNRTRGEIEKRDLEISLLKKETVVYQLEEELDEIPKFKTPENKIIETKIADTTVFDSKIIEDTSVKNHLVSPFEKIQEKSQGEIQEKITKENDKNLDEKIEEVFAKKTKEIAEKKETISVKDALKEPINLIPNETPKKKITLNSVEEITEQPFDEIARLLSDPDDASKKDTGKNEVENEVKNEVKKTDELKTKTLEEELDGTISVDVMADLFEKAPVKKSLNDFLQSTIQIDLNDRIVFVRHLFNGNQNDFNRVISQLNTFKTEKEAKNFINKMIKPDYNWSGKEVHEARLFEIIERRFA
ncbi:hypothetical protein [Tenacibaculum finnmarkense]|uniref:hypothetical protein n=1 Tax=Tenacibaculum finnmarkense TaxID=2781243 RepID=UPI00187B30AD|nr:hypothetical protein [Tenacibaculum finnmarkense]MBE7649102.1 hypothetical protein [Tenacibaculum finnmarkense genomovar ulcerans]MCG8802699.1 hypothetical protein [Tenacibaculum finnmarkense]MCG8808143.1 hypothetical protein [Tenacibaculum finnmarkense]MCG8818468.1 hypothetical protein [Tenacibaculum finnmarkense]MCG8825427.1 hypothetical protein [Tenacibaculum finnmarkense]